MGARACHCRRVLVALVRVTWWHALGYTWGNVGATMCALSSGAAMAENL